MERTQATPPIPWTRKMRGQVYFFAEWGVGIYVVEIGGD